jgi:phage gp29-like protein
VTPAQEIARNVGAVDYPPPHDPAFASPADPLGDGGALRAQAGVVRRDIPIVLSATALTISDVRAAIGDLTVGLFDAPAQVVDVLTGDSRVAAGLASRVGGLLGREVQFEIPRKLVDSSAAQECRDAFADRWPTMAPESVLSELCKWAVMLGNGLAQMPWDMGGEYATPHPRIWHPRYTWYHWTARRMIANTQDGVAVIEPGDGHWIQHAPHGFDRGWMRGALRPIAPWMIARNLALRDAARWSEANGMPMIKFSHPAGADRLMVEKARLSLSNRGGETCVALPQNIPGVQGDSAGYDVTMLEAGGVGFEGFFKLIDACDREITLALQAQTLTSSMPEGGASYAAARVHADVKQALLEADARSLERTVYLQIARPFALMNFGNADLAPRIVFDLTPYEDFKTRAATALTVTQAAVNMANAGFAFGDPEDFRRFGRQFGVDLGKLVKSAPRIMGAGGGGFGGGEKENARIAALVQENRRLRIAAGEDPHGELAAEVEALAALSDLPSRKVRRARGRS